MPKTYLTDEECKEYGLPLGSYLGGASDDLPSRDAAHYCDDFAAYSE